jgi:hypothetical protein
MAVRANDVALGKLSLESLTRYRARAPAYPERLCERLAAFEIHHIGRECPATIRAFPAAELAKELDCSALPPLDSL